MMEFITIPLVVGICVAGVYGLFDLFVRKKERLAIIEKMSEKISSIAFDGKLTLPSFNRFSFSALKIGFLMAGIGLGLLVAFFLNIAFADLIKGNDWHQREVTSVLYGASVLLFGGIGLLVAFIIEIKINKDKK
ncbi:hypothetical protein M2480_001259 [Parabacteroides sp. PFB2-12]|uniref:DUF6249 domain-containing protein n=1 Tax=unclassified Parabacteroides TaxID=2649774 RepID=UPI0024769E13|nr:MULTISPECIES: DUF6249 domain-containing protein [unclassified Parabacteroides]MDH6343270.1 hypothetical protein [Parabacteroides sp. PM6-13]MDH6390286.1 hypothetical protein [Parabacteroides sp. PFB2-12]